MIKQAIAGVLSVGAVGSGALVVEDRYANDEPTKQQIAAVEDRLEEKIVGDDYYLTQQQIWRYEDRLANDPENQYLKDLKRELEFKKDDLKRSLETLRQKRMVE